MIRKELPDGTWVEFVDHVLQSPEENLSDMIAFFFRADCLSDMQLQKIFESVLEIANSYIEYISIANTIAEQTEFYDLAKEVYKIAEKYIETIFDIEILEDKIENYFQDKDWLDHLKSLEKNFRYQNFTLETYADPFLVDMQLTRIKNILN